MSSRIFPRRPLVSLLLFAIACAFQCHILSAQPLFSLLSSNDAEGVVGEERIVSSNSWEFSSSLGTPGKIATKFPIGKSHQIDKEARDPYWQYYADCDQWGIEFASQTETGIFKKANQHLGPLESSAFSNSLRIKAVKFSKRPHSSRSYFLTRKFDLTIQWIESSCRAGCSSFEMQFSRLIFPQIQWLEFHEVETRIDPEFYLRVVRKPSWLQPCWGRVQTQLDAAWGWKISQINARAISDFHAELDRIRSIACFGDFILREALHKFGNY
jgi:hypothetical protein